MASCNCGTAPKLIFPCSGAADVGEIADRAARQLSRDGDGSMYCLAGIGGGVSGIIESTRSAAGVLAIDGCPVACARKTLERQGLTEFEYVQVTDLGMEKGKAPVSPENIDTVVRQGKKLLDSCGGGGCCG